MQRAATSLWESKRGHHGIEQTTKSLGYVLAFASNIAMSLRWSSA
jgi:hypothetical protein